MSGQEPYEIAQPTPSLEEKFGKEVAEMVHELRQEAADRRVELKDYKDLGSTEDLKRAMALFEASKTPEGLDQILAEIAQVRGYDLGAITGQSEPQQQADPGEVDPKTGDLVLQPEDLERITQGVAQHEVANLRQQLEVDNITNAVNAELDALGVTDPSYRDDVLSRAGRIAVHKSQDRVGAIEAVREAHAHWTGELDALGELAVDRYLKGKAKDDMFSPAGITGNSVIGSDEPTPKNASEASERLRRRLDSIGELT